MATRNLTKQYLDIRSATKANRSLLREGGVDFDGDDKLLNVSIFLMNFVIEFLMQYHRNKAKQLIGML